MYPFFESLADCMSESLFLDEFARKYHYEEEQMTTLSEVASAMQKCIKQDIARQRAGWRSGGLEGELTDRGASQEPGRLCPVCITLGPGVDSLQNRYLEAGLLSEAYMVEALGSELLLKAYPHWNEHVMAAGKYVVRRYHFLGSSPEHPIEKLPELLEKLQMPVTCTVAYCILPKKTVAFYAELADAESSRGVACEGICAGCGSAHCPNRMQPQHTGYYAADMTDRPFTYGYSRILGLPR